MSSAFRLRVLTANGKVADMSRISCRLDRDYGQTYSHGSITCDSELSGVTCADTATGHFFRVSRENYERG